MKQDAHIQQIIRSVRQNVARALPEEKGVICQRRSVRRRVLKGAKISYCGYYADLDCRISSLSDHGALLVLSESNFCLSRFKLTIPMDGVEMDCRVVQRDGVQVRVEFCSEKRSLSKEDLKMAGMLNNPFLMPISM